MAARSVVVFAALAGIGAGSPVLAQSVEPAAVLAARAPAKPGLGFAARTARLTSIIGSEAGTAAPLRLPARPVWVRPVRHEADAAAGLR